MFEDNDAEEPARAMISEEAAVHAAREAIRGHVELSEGGEIRVEVEDERVIVEFRRPLVPGERGPDYDARVTLDAMSGEVLDILGGS